MESELRKAAVKGDVPSLHDLLTKDELLLDRIMTGNQTETPLHIAAMLGHLDFVDHILARKPEMTREQDSQNSTPLHLAAAKGYYDIVASLLRVDPEVCFVRDKYERNPLHVAAMKGHVDVLKLLVQTRPNAVRDVVEHGQTILHLCVKHNRLETLKLLINILGDDQFINSTDEYGDSILHLAAADRQTKTIIFLIDKGVNQNITNSRGFTALSLLAQDGSTGRASDAVVEEEKEEEREKRRKWQDSMHQTLMLVATLLATMSFQASITPPGGLWQEDFPVDKNNPSHNAGESIMATYYPVTYKRFIACNTTSFVASLSIIILLISGLPLKRRRITTWIAMLTMWVAITFMAATYAISVYVFTPGSELKTFRDATRDAAVVWFALMALIFLGHLVRLIVKFVRKDSTRRRPEEEQTERPEP